jgi:hypothetical protein
MELAEQSPTSSAADVNKLSCAIHSIPKSPQEQLPCSPHDAFVGGEVLRLGLAALFLPEADSDAGTHDANHALRRPASEKRQGTKSRWGNVGECRNYGDFVAGSGVDVVERGGNVGNFATRHVPCIGVPAS